MKNFYTRFIFFAVTLPVFLAGKLENNLSPLNKKDIGGFSIGSSVIEPTKKTAQLIQSKGSVLNKEIKNQTIVRRSSQKYTLYKIDSLGVNSSIEKMETELTPTEKGIINADPIKFTITTDKQTVKVGEEIEITIKLELLPVTPQMLFTLEELKDYTLKVVMPKSFVQTGGDYQDYIKGTLGSKKNEISYKIIGRFNKANETDEFVLMRGDKDATEASIFILKERLLVKAVNPDSFSNTPQTDILLGYNEAINQQNLKNSSSTNSCDNSDAEFTVTVTENTPPTINATKTFLCNNETSTLTATGCDGNIKWNTGNLTTSLVVSSAGIYFATCTTNACGESGISNNIEIQKGGTPPAPIISTDRPNVCGTEKATLTGTGCTGGSIKWNTGVTATSIEVGEGTYTATCINACGQSGLSNPITILSSGTPVAPNVLADKTTICGTEIATLTVSNCNGAVVWSTNQTATGITVNMDGVYSAKCHSSCGISPKSNEVTITKGIVPNPATITSNKTSLCDNEVATLTATGCTGTVLWNSSTWHTGTTINVTVAGTYKAVCSNACGISSESNSIQIRRNYRPLTPVIGFPSGTNLICNPEVITLAAMGCNGTVTWNNGQTGSSINVNIAGTYNAKCINSCGESSNSNPAIVVEGARPPILSASKLTICGIETSILTASNCNGTVKWSTGATTNQITVNVTGIYTARCINSCGTSPNSEKLVISSCGSTASFADITETAAGRNVSPMIFGPVTVCKNSAVTLTANNCSGIVQWCANGSIITTGVSGNKNEVLNIPSLATTTTYHIKCSEKPVLTAGTGSLCGTSTTFLDTKGCSAETVYYEKKNGSTWQVYPNSSGSPERLNDVGAGIYRVKCNITDGESLASNEVTINQSAAPNPPVIAAEKNKVCPENGTTPSVKLVATGCSDKVIWNNGSEGTLITVNITTTTTYTAKCVAKCGSSDLESSVSNAETITYLATCPCDDSVITLTDNTSYDVINEENTLELEVTNISGSSYQWSMPTTEGVTINNNKVTIPNIQPKHAGKYSVIVGCNNLQYSKYVHVKKIDRCATPFFHFAYSLSPNREKGIGDEVRFVADGGDSYEWTGPDGFYSKNQFPVIPLATEANEGTYNVKISKTIGTQVCEVVVPVEVKLSPCSFDAGPVMSETGSNFELKLWANKPLDGAIIEWFRNGTLISTNGNFIIPKTNENRGTYTLKINYRSCIVQKDIAVDYVAPPSLDGHLDFVSCDGIRGWIRDLNNQSKNLYYKVRIKIGDEFYEQTVRSSGGNGFTPFEYVPDNKYKNGVKHNVVVEVLEGSTWKLIRNTTMRSFRCCNLELAEEPLVNCSGTSGFGTIDIKVKEGLMGSYQFFLERQERDDDGNVIYKAISNNWEPANAGTSKHTYLNQPSANYRIKVREGNESDACMVSTGIAVACDNPTVNCNAPIVTVFPSGELREGTGIRPKLYADVLPPAQTTGLQDGLYLGGNGGLAFSTNYNYLFANFSLEAWVSPASDGSITIGDISDGSRQRYLYKGYTNEVSKAALYISIGSNGINLIEQGTDYRRVALSYEGRIAGWNHIAVVYQNNLPKLFINGQLVRSGTVLPPLGIQIVGPNGIGFDRGLGYKGSIYALRVWTTALANQTVDQLRNNLNPTLATEPNVGFWIFDKPPVANNVEDLSTHKRKAKLEGDATIRIIKEPVQSPNANVITWWLAGIKVGTGPIYTVPADKVRAGTLNYVVKYQKTDGSYCETTKPIVILPPVFGSLSGCYVITTENGQKPLTPSYNAAIGLYSIKKGFQGQGFDKQIWRFEHLGDEIYRINSAFYTDMVLDAVAANATFNGIGMRDKRFTNNDSQRWKAFVKDAGSLTFSFAPQHDNSKKLQYYWDDNAPISLGTVANGSEGTLEKFTLQSVACPLPASDCNVNNKVTIERWMNAPLFSMDDTQWNALNVAQYINTNQNSSARHIVKRQTNGLVIDNDVYPINAEDGNPPRPSVWPENRWLERQSGYLCAPVNGDYTFYIRTDEWAELWMSTDENPANKILVAKCYGYADNFVERPWEQRSVPVTLSKGRSYYFEVITKDNNGTHFVRVAWIKPGDNTPESQLQPMPLTNISLVPRDVVLNTLTVSADKLKAAPTENVVLTATGCNFGRVIWRVGVDIIQNPTQSLPTLTRTGPGIFQALCVGDYTVNQDWVTVKVEASGPNIPSVTATPLACANKVLSLQVTNPTAGLTVKWWQVKPDAASQTTFNENRAAVEKPNDGQYIFNNNAFANIFNTWTGTTPTGTPLPTGFGKFYVAFLNANGFCYEIKEIVVATALPESVRATNNGPVTAGNELQLSVSPVNGATYAWAGPATENPQYTSANRTAVRANFSPEMAGVYTLTITASPDAGGCTATTTTTVEAANCDIYIKSTNPAAANAETYTLPRKTGVAGGFDPLTLKVEPIEGTSTFAAYTIKWYLNGNEIPNATSISLTADKIGEYQAVLTQRNNPTTQCVAKVNLNAIPCKVYDAPPTCGTAPGNIEIPNALGTGIPLAAGDKFTAGDYQVVITEITSGSPSGYNGKGYIEFRFINQIVINQVAISLENAVVNECYQLSGGKVVTQYDPDWKGILDVDSVAEDVKNIMSNLFDIYETLFDNIEILDCSSESLSKINSKVVDLNNIKNNIDELFNISESKKVQYQADFTSIIGSFTCQIQNACPSSSNNLEKRIRLNEYSCNLEDSKTKFQNLICDLFTAESINESSISKLETIFPPNDPIAYYTPSGDVVLLPSTAKPYFITATSLPVHKSALIGFELSSKIYVAKYSKFDDVWHFIGYYESGNPSATAYRFSGGRPDLVSNQNTINFTVVLGLVVTQAIEKGQTLTELLLETGLTLPPDPVPPPPSTWTFLKRTSAWCAIGAAFYTFDDSYTGAGRLTDELPVVDVLPRPISQIPVNLPITIPHREPTPSGNCHVYVIWGPNFKDKNGEMDIAKYGMTCRNDCESRPSTQVKRFREEHNVNTFDYAWLFRNKSKEVAHILEKSLTASYILVNQGRLPPKHKLPCFKEVPENDPINEFDNVQERIKRVKDWIAEQIRIYGQ